MRGGCGTERHRAHVGVAEWAPAPDVAIDAVCAVLGVGVFDVAFVTGASCPIKKAIGGDADRHRGLVMVGPMPQRIVVPIGRVDHPCDGSHGPCCRPHKG